MILRFYLSIICACTGLICQLESVSLKDGSETNHIEVNEILGSFDVDPNFAV